MRNILCYLILLTLPAFSGASALSPGKNRIDTNLLAKQFSRVSALINKDIFLAKKTAFEMLANSISIKDKKWEAAACNTIGVVYFQTGDYDSSQVYYKKALEFAEKYHYDDIKIKSTGNLGLLYSRRGDYENAIRFLFESLQLNEKKGNQLATARNLADIGNTYLFMGKPGKSKAYLDRSLSIFRQLDNKHGIANVLNSIGQYLEDTDKGEEAMEYYKQSYILKLETGDKKGASTSLMNIADYLSEIGKHDEALNYLKITLELKKQIDDKESIVMLYNNIGLIYKRKKNYRQAITWFLKAYESSVEIKSSLIIKTSAMNLSEIYDSIGNYKQALEFNKIYYRTKIELSDESSTAKITEIEAKYKSEKKDIENAMLLKENKVKELKIKDTEMSKKVQLLIFISITLLIFIAVFIIYSRIRQRQKDELTKEQNRLEKLRFRAIIDSEEKERIRIAKELHDGLGQLLSSAKLNIAGLEGNVKQEDEYLLENSSKIIDEAVQEVRSISHNMMPTALMNYGLVSAVKELARRVNDTKQISVDFECTGFNCPIEKEIEISLYRIIQEILNNMIKHARAKNIGIRLSCTREQVNLFIKDDGTGFNVSEIKNSKGIGWQNIYSRVSLLNGKIEINSKLSAGTEILITLSRGTLNHQHC